MRRAVVARLASGALTALVMSGAVSGCVLLTNGGFTPGFISHWLGSWFIAFAIALPAGLLIGPAAERLRRWLEAGDHDAS